jgi:hypothetical protein
MKKEKILQRIRFRIKKFQKINMLLLNPKNEKNQKKNFHNSKSSLGEKSELFLKRKRNSYKKLFKLVFIEKKFSGQFKSFQMKRI